MSEDVIIFRERQKFKQWWIWLLLLAVNGMLIFGIFKQVILGHTFGSKPATNTELLIVEGIILFVSFLISQFRLDTVIQKDGIYVQFFPLHLKKRFYPWDSLSRCYIRKYAPLAEYGGWGYRFGLGGKGIALNVSGNIGLQLELTNGKKLLIGTQKGEEMSKALATLHELK